MKDRSRIKGTGGGSVGGGSAVTAFTVFVLTVATFWLLFQVYTRRLAPVLAPAPEDALDGEEEGEGEGEAGGNRTKASPTLPTMRQALKNLQFKAQVNQLLAIPVPIILSQAALNSKMDFSCGGSHVVKLKAYQDITKLRYVQDALPEYDMFLASKSDKIFKRCAVVGNSGSLLESEHGREIDSHDIVIRFNAGITQGYEQFVGSKTTFRMLNSPDAVAKEKGEITITTLRDEDMRRWAVNTLNTGRKASALCTDPEFLCYSWQWVRNTGHKPSTGLVGLVLALKVCRNVTMYGFQSSNYFSHTSRPHYYDWERPAKGRERVHPFTREVALYKQLHATGFITMVTDERN